MTTTLLGDGPCWTLSHETAWSDDDIVPHYDSELDALWSLAREINRAAGDLRRAAGPRPHLSALAMVAADEDHAHLLTDTAAREGERCAEVRCDGCGDEAEWDDWSATHTFLSEVDRMVDTLGWSSYGEQHFCFDCPVPDDVAAEHAVELARQPGPDDVPLFDLTDGAG